MVYPLLPLHCSYWWKTDLSSHVFSVKGLYSLRINHSCDGEMSQWRNGKERKKSSWEIQYICSRYTTQPRSPVVLISHTNVDISHHLSPSSPMTLHVCLQTVTSSLMGKFPHVMAQISPFFFNGLLVSVGQHMVSRFVICCLVDVGMRVILASRGWNWNGWWPQMAEA